MHVAFETFAMIGFSEFVNGLRSAMDVRRWKGRWHPTARIMS
jgi:hypothetical protein